MTQDGTKITGLTDIEALTGAEQIPVGKPGITQKVSVAALKEHILEGVSTEGCADASELEALKAQVQANTESSNANMARIEANQEAISENLATIEANNESRKTHEQEAWDIINANTAKSKENEDAIATKANASDVYTKEEVDGFVALVTEAVKGIHDTNASDNLRLTALETFPHDRFLTVEQLPSTDHLATKEEVEAKFNELLGTDSTTLENIEKLSQMLQEGDENTVAALNTMLNDYYTKQECDDKYVSKVEHDDANWAEKSWCSENFETKSDAANTYQPQGDYALKSDLDPLARAEDIPHAYDDTDLQERVTHLEEIAGEDISDEKLQSLVKNELDAYDFSELEYDDTDLKARVQTLESKPGYDDSAVTDRLLALETADHAYDDAEVKARLDEIEAFDHASKQDVKDAIAELRGGSDETVQSLTKLKEVLTEGNVGQITEALEGYSPKEHSHDDLASKDHTHDTSYASKDHSHSGYLTTESLGDYAKKSQAVSGVSVGEKTLDVTKGDETLNLTIPYATKAGDADKLGGVLPTNYVKCSIVGNVDLNTLTQSGIYRFNDKSENMPSSNHWGQVMTIRGTGNSDTVAQICFAGLGTYNGRVFVRNGVVKNLTNGELEWKRLALITDNVASATKLQTSRTIWGQVFDGTANVSGTITTANHRLSGTLYQTTPSSKSNYNQGIRLAGTTKDNCYSIISFGCDPEADTNTHANQWTMGRNSGNNFVCDRSGADGSRGFIITTAGNMGIGRADASYKLDVNGTARCSTLTQTSDARLKENVADYELPLAVIADAPSVTYNWKADGKQDIGGIAQYWEQAQPLLTDRDNEGMLSMEYGKTAYLAAVTLAKEVQKLQAKIAELEAKLADK